MQGAKPLASLALNRLRHLQTLPFRCPAGCARLVACRPCHQLAFLPPSPRPPSQREGGDLRLFHARGFAPCIPEAEPGRRGLFLWKTVPQGGACPRGCRLALLYRRPRGGCLSPRLPTMPFAYRFSPIPPSALAERSSRREGGDQGYFMQGASPLASPAFNRLRHLQTLPFRCPGQACHGTGHEPAFMKIIGKSSWGFGGFFQEAPNASPFYSFSNAARVQAGFKTHSRSG